MSNKNVNYKHTSVIHENYWFQDLPNTIFNLDYALKIFPEQSMTYPEKINSLVRLSIYLGLILGLFYSNYLYLYIPIITMLMTYLLYIFRLEHVENTLAQKGPHAGLSHLKNNNNNVNNKLNNNSNINSNINFTKEELKKLQKTLGLSNEDLRKKGLDLNTMSGEDFQNVLNIKTCSKPSTNNPFMNALVYDSRTKDHSCDPINPDNQDKIEGEYNKYCIKDISDIYNHNSGRRQFYTMPSTTYPNNQEGLANWLYKTPPTCKEGNGAQCVANYYTPLNSSLLTPGYGSSI